MCTNIIFDYTYPKRYFRDKLYVYQKSVKIQCGLFRIHLIYLLQFVNK